MFSAESSFLHCTQILGASTSFRRTVVSSRDVILPSAVFIAGNLIILTLWQILSPLKFKLNFDEDGSVDEFGRPNSTYATCESESGWSTFFLLLIFILNGAAVVAANVQVYRARRITTEFGESRFIAISMGVTLQVLLIALPIFLLDSSITIRAMARSFLVVLCSGSILFFIFVPKIFFLRAHDKDRLERRRRLDERRKLASRDLPFCAASDDADIYPVDEGEDESEKIASCAEKSSDGALSRTGARRRSQRVNAEEIGMEVFVIESVELPRRRRYSDSSSGLRISSSVKSSSEFPSQGSTTSLAGNSGSFAGVNRENRSGEIRPSGSSLKKEGHSACLSSPRKDVRTLRGTDSGDLSQEPIQEVSDRSEEGSIDAEQDVKV